MARMITDYKTVYFPLGAYLPSVQVGGGCQLMPFPQLGSDWGAHAFSEADWVILPLPQGPACSCCFPSWQVTGAPSAWVLTATPWAILPQPLLGAWAHTPLTWHYTMWCHAVLAQAVTAPQYLLCSHFTGNRRSNETAEKSGLKVSWISSFWEWYMEVPTWKSLSRTQVSYSNLVLLVSRRRPENWWQDWGQTLPRESPWFKQIPSQWVAK